MSLIFSGIFTLITFNFSLIQYSWQKISMHAYTVNVFDGQAMLTLRDCVRSFYNAPLSPWLTTLPVPFVAASCASYIWQNNIQVCCLSPELCSLLLCSLMFGSSGSCESLALREHRQSQRQSLIYWEAKPVPSVPERWLWRVFCTDPVGPWEHWVSPPP